MGPLLRLPPLDGRVIPLEGAPFGLLPAPAETVPQEFPHTDRAIAHAKPPVDEHGNALEGPQLGRVPRRARAPQEQLPEAFLLDLRQPRRAAGNRASA